MFSMSGDFVPNKDLACSCFTWLAALHFLESDGGAHSRLHTAAYQATQLHDDITRFVFPCTLAFACLTSVFAPLKLVPTPSRGVCSSYTITCCNRAELDFVHKAMICLLG